MQTRPSHLSVTPAKMLLFAAAVSIYCIAAVWIFSETEALPFALVAALLPAVAYVIAGGSAIHICEVTRRWSFPDTYQPWPEELKFILGVIWPGVVVFWLTVGMFNHFAAPQEKVS